MKGKSQIFDTSETWFKEIDAPREKGYEDTLVARFDYIFPDYHVARFKQTITDIDGNTSRPDLAMIRKDYSAWIVVEVEIASHPYSDVASQVSVFRKGIYGYENATYLCTKNGDIVLDKMKKLIEDESPSVMVVVNEAKPDWKKRLKRDYECEICVFQVYRSTEPTEVFRISGYYPFIIEETTRCEFPRDLRTTALRLDEPAVIDAQDGDLVEVIYRQRTYEWKKRANYLTPTGYLPIPVDREYAISRTRQGEYILEII